MARDFAGFVIILTKFYYHITVCFICLARKVDGVVALLVR